MPAWSQSPYLGSATQADLKPLRAAYPPRYRRCEPYAEDIERAVKRWWGPWRHPDAWAAQIWQESTCDPKAVSPAGARGLAQFMGGTWSDARDRLNLPPGSTPHDRLAIDAGAWYQASRMRVWSAPRPQLERWRLGLASYNAGAGHIIEAQRLCGGARDWSEIEICLPAVTGHHSIETRGYVRRIERHWRDLGACDPLAAPRDVQEAIGCSQHSRPRQRWEAYR